jgi:exodeoxyribonuclease VII large subunit
MLADPRPLLQGKRYAVAELSASIVESGRSLVRDRRDRVERLTSTVRLHSPAVRVSGKRGEVAVLVGRARAGIEARGSRLRSSLTLMAGKLSALDPKAVLTRGYAIAVDRRTGKAVRSVAETRPGQPIDVQVSDGSFGAVVEGRKP